MSRYGLNRVRKNELLKNSSIYDRPFYNLY
jgi:hypothetical protein